MSEYVGYRVNPDPEYWHVLAKEDFATATVLTQAGRWGASVLHSHAAIEKSLKRILALKGLLTEDDRTHSLLLLASKAGIDKMLEPAGLSTLMHYNDLHEKASYPADLVKYRMINEEGYAKMVWQNTCKLVKFINTVAEGIIEEEGQSE